MELKISGPNGVVQSVELTGATINLGRSADNALPYPGDPWLSRYHLCFEKAGREWWVRDCGSRNGTKVNETLLASPHNLRAGDRIVAGLLTIRVVGRQESAEVVSFISQGPEASLRGPTIVTNLDKILRETAQAAKQPSDSSRNASRVVHSLIRAGRELAGHQSLEELFPVILELALSAIEAQRGVILTLEGEDLVVRASKGDEFAISTAVRDRVLREQCSLVISDAQSDDALKLQQSIVAHRVRSIMAVPLQTGKRVIGLIYVDNGAFLRPFQHDDLELLTVMANVAAIRIEHARLAEVEQQERLMALELTQASEIQQSLLPSEAPSIEGYDLSGYNLPCRTVGGDYFDFTHHTDGRLGLAVGDVSGKGLPAALMMSSLQARVQMLAATQPDPASAMTVLNRELTQRCPPGKFITFFYALLQPETGRLTYSNAGHNYPLLIRANGDVEQLPGSNMVLGIMPSVQYQLLESGLYPGDMLALYSDGVTEARTCEGEEFGESGLANYLVQSRLLSCAETIRSLEAHLRGWCGGANFHDDFTILLVKRH